ncbi:MAG: segregation/condensation protein A [bacterium]|nr:segregation/condensation protein A [bacterium]
MYEVKTAQFEGPLDLLLGLIEKRKVSINDVSLAGIAERYLEYLRRLRNFPLEEAAGFVVIASTLMVIKSRSLMPSMELTEEEERSIEELEDRLKIYRRIRDLSVHLENLFGKNPLFERGGLGVLFASPEEKKDFIEPEGVTKETLRSCLDAALKKLPEKESLPEAEVKRIISLEDKIMELSGRIQDSLEVSFSEFSVSRGDIGSGDKRVEIIISFLAMLELVKQGFIMVRQEDLFDSINIRKNGE